MISRLFLFFALALTATPATYAEDFTLSDAWSDTTQYFTSPLRWDRGDWELFGATAAAVVVAHQYDSKVRNHFAGHSPVLDGKDKNSTRDAVPAAALVAGGAVGIYSGGFTLNRRETRHDSLAFSLAPTEVGGLSLQVVYTH